MRWHLCNLFPDYGHRIQELEVGVWTLLQGKIELSRRYSSDLLERMSDSIRNIYWSILPISACSLQEMEVRLRAGYSGSPEITLRRISIGRY